MENINYKRSGALINAGHMYSMFTVILLIAALVNRSLIILGIAFGCFILTTISTSIAILFYSDENERPGKLKLFIGFVVLLPYTLIGSVLLIIISAVLKICFGKRGDSPYE